MGQSMNVHALLKVQPRIKSELSSHVVRRSSVSMGGFYRIKSIRAC